MKIFNIAEILSPDLGSRAKTRAFRRFVDENYSGEPVMIDFSGVQFSSTKIFQQDWSQRVLIMSLTYSFFLTSQ